MNNERRRAIRAIERQLDVIKGEIDSAAAEEETEVVGDKELLASREENWSSRVEDFLQEVGMLRDDEQEYFDNMPEGLQASERGSSAEDAISNLQDVWEHLNELVNLEDVGEFTRLFNEKYDDLTSLLQDAAS